MSINIIEVLLDTLLLTIYNIAKGNGREGKLVTKAQEKLKEDIERIKDDTTIEKVRIFIMGILAQQSISENKYKQELQQVNTQ